MGRRGKGGPGPHTEWIMALINLIYSAALHVCLPTGLLPTCVVYIPVMSAQAASAQLGPVLCSTHMAKDNYSIDRFFVLCFTSLHMYV